MEKLIKSKRLKMLQGMFQGHAVRDETVAHDLLEVRDFEETSEISQHVSLLAIVFLHAGGRSSKQTEDSSTLLFAKSVIET